MIIFWFAGALLVLWILLWSLAYAQLTIRGGQIPVDNERDINNRYFAHVLRNLLKGALVPGWGQEKGPWRFGNVEMRRKMEPVAVHMGDLRLGSVPRKVAALVVAGDLTVADGLELPFDVWCLGNATVGARCRLRVLMAEKSVTVGDQTLVERWLDAGHLLRIGAGVAVAAAASAGQEVVLSKGFQGGRVSAPTIRTSPPGDTPELDRAALLETAARWTLLRNERAAAAAQAGCDPELEWFTPQSATLNGDYWAGPGTVILHDLVGRGAIRIANDCVVAGSIHADGELRIGARTLVTGSIACRDLIIEPEAVVLRSAHAEDDAVLGEGAVVGLAESAGGVASATGSIHLSSPATLSLRIVAGNAVLT